MAAAAAAAALWGGGCSSDPAPASLSPSSPTRADCGTFTLRQGDEFPADAARCLVAAVEAGTPARLTVTRPSVEGALIPTTWQTDATGRIEVTTDDRLDPFGGQQITRQTCETVAVGRWGLETADCSAPAPVTNE